MLNPEFRRYLWTELSLHKLIAMPVVLGAAFALAEMVRFGAADAAKYGFMITVFLWGTRRAAAAVAEEVRGGTWDSQRMSALDAWPMAWAKLFGSTIFSWYGGLICLGVYAAFSLESVDAVRVAKSVVVFVLVGLIAQAVGLAASLAFLRKHRGERNIPVSLCHLIGLGTLIVLGSLSMQFGKMFWNMDWYDMAARWHGIEFNVFEFFLVSSFAALGWAVLAVHRLMRAELQHRTWPWGWAAFTLYLAVYLSGYGNGGDTAAALGNLLAVGFAVAAATTYLAFLLENKNIVVVKAWLEALGARRWAAMVLLTPSWLVCLCLALAAGVMLTGFVVLADTSDPFRYFTPRGYLNGPFVAAAVLFMLRDIGFLLFMNLATRLRRPDLAGAIYLIVLYSVGGGLLSQLDYAAALAFVVPDYTGNAFLTIAPVLVQVIAVYALLVYRLRGAMRPAAVPAA
jgi:hypothetical protein